MSIYGTRGGPFPPSDYAVSTQAGGTVYVHILNWPESGVVLPARAESIESARTLGGRNVEVRAHDSGLQLVVASEDRVAPDTIVVLKLAEK